MSENLKTATKLIEQGHVRIGPELVKDPAFLITRNLEDFVTWVDSSKIKRHVLDYSGQVKLQFYVRIFNWMLQFTSSNQFCIHRMNGNKSFNDFNRYIGND